MAIFLIILKAFNVGDCFKNRIKDFGPKMLITIKILSIKLCTMVANCKY